MTATGIHIPKTTPESHPWRRRWLGTPSYWLAQSIGWGAVLLLQLATAFSQERYAAALPISLFIVAAVLGTHVFRVYLIHLRGGKHTGLSFILRALCGLILTAVACTLVSALLAHFNSKGIRPEERFSYFSFFGVLFTLVPWLSLYFGVNYYRSYRQSTIDRLRLETAVKDAELRLLRSQVDPHFLFNSLNTLRALIPEDFATPQELATARDAISLLSDVLRTSLLSGTRSAVSLAEELEHVENFVSLEKLRFESRLNFTRAIAPEALACLVPPLLVQSLVENAIKYGIATRETGGRIELYARVEKSELSLIVTNPGNLNQVSVTTGVGLKNARARLALIFGPTATLCLTQTRPDLVQTAVRIPALTTLPELSSSP